MPTVTPIATVRAVLDAVDTAAATTALVALGAAPVASPALTGTPTAPTAAANTNTTQVATTAFAKAEADAAEAASQPLYLTTVDPSGGTAGSIRIATAKLPTGSVAPTTMGVGAVDLQLIRTNASKSASGSYSFATGYSNTASGSYSFATGYSNTASGSYSFATGYSNIASGSYSFATGSGTTASGSYSFASGNFTTASGQGSFATGEGSNASRASQVSIASGIFTDAGDAQSTRLVLKGTTTNTATPLELLNNGARLTIASGFIFACTIQIAGVKTDGSQAAHYVRKVIIKNISGTTALVGAVSTVGTDVEDDAAWDVAITADNTNDALAITVTGTASDTIRWVATVEAVEIGIA